MTTNVTHHCCFRYIAVPHHLKRLMTEYRNVIEMLYFSCKNLLTKAYNRYILMLISTRRPEGKEKMITNQHIVPGKCEHKWKATGKRFTCQRCGRTTSRKLESKTGKGEGKVKCTCGAVKTETTLGQGYVDRKGNWHYQCRACFDRDNPSGKHGKAPSRTAET